MGHKDKDTIEYTLKKKKKKPEGFPGGSVIRICLPLQETQETQVQSLDWEYPLEKELATHSNILAWEILRTKESGGLQSMGWSQKSPTQLSD